MHHPRWSFTIWKPINSSVGTPFPNPMFKAEHFSLMWYVNISHRESNIAWRQSVENWLYVHVHHFNRLSMLRRMIVTMRLPTYPIWAHTGLLYIHSKMTSHGEPPTTSSISIHWMVTTMLAVLTSSGQTVSLVSAWAHRRKMGKIDAIQTAT